MSVKGNYRTVFKIKQQHRGIESPIQAQMLNLQSKQQLLIQIWEIKWKHKLVELLNQNVLS